MALNQQLAVAQQLQQLLTRGQRQLRAVRLRRALLRGCAVLLLSSPLLPLVVLLYSFWQPLPPLPWLLAAALLPVLLGFCAAAFYYRQDSIDRRSVLMLYQRQLRVADSLTTADEFLQQQTPLSDFQQAAVAQAAAILPRAQRLMLNLPPLQQPTRYRRYWPALALAVVLTAATYWRPMGVMVDEHGQRNSTAALSESLPLQDEKHQASVAQTSPSPASAKRAEQASVNAQRQVAANSAQRQSATGLSSTANTATVSQSAAAASQANSQTKQVSGASQLSHTATTASAAQQDKPQTAVDDNRASSSDAATGAEPGALQQAENRQQTANKTSNHGVSSAPQRSQQQRPQPRQAGQDGQQQGQNPSDSGQKGQRTDGNSGAKKSHGVNSLLLAVPMLDQLLGQQGVGPQVQQQVPAEVENDLPEAGSASDRANYQGALQPVAGAAQSLPEQQLLQRFFDRSKQTENGANQENE